MRSLTQSVWEKTQGRHTSGGGKAIKGNTQKVKFWVILQWFLSMAIEKKTFSGETFLREFYIVVPSCIIYYKYPKIPVFSPFSRLPEWGEIVFYSTCPEFPLRRLHRGSEMYRIRSFPVSIHVPQVQPGEHTWKAFPRHLVFEIWHSREVLADLRGPSVLSIYSTA